MSIPVEFIDRATALGYFDTHGGRSVMEQAYDDIEREVKLFATANGFLPTRDGFRIWATKGEETYLLAAAADAGDDPMNLWAQAFQRMELILDTDFQGKPCTPLRGLQRLAKAPRDSQRGAGAPA